MTLYMLCAPATLEKDVWAALRGKKDFQEKQWYAETLAATADKYKTEIE